MTDLTYTIELAAECHDGQVDKQGQPYILHVLRVMLAMQTDEERQVALLHDVVEDTAMSLADLRQRAYSDRVLDAVDALSRREGETYADYIERVAQNALATKVKRADLLDNINRLHALPDQAEAQRLGTRYIRAFNRLRPPMPQPAPLEQLLADRGIEPQPFTTLFDKE